jgi:formylglycine-generating enzyme required for sulfatase activity
VPDLNPPLDTKEQPNFIHDQGLSLLYSDDPHRRRQCLDPQLLRPLRRNQQFAMDATGLDPQQEYLKNRALTEQDLEMSWHEIFERDSILDREIRRDQLHCDSTMHPVPDSISLNRLCIVSDAGMGKSKLVEWLLYRINNNHGTPANELAFKVDLSKLEQVWMSNVVGLKPACFFDVLIRFVASQTLTEISSAKGAIRELQQTALELLLTQRSKDGKLTLLVDGLDQISDKSELLAEFLNSADREIQQIRLIVAGRSNAILMQWKQAFSNPAWTFVRVEPFTVDQQRRYLGWLETVESDRSLPKRELRYSKIPMAARELLCIPRVLEYLREVNDYQEIRTAADVYFHALQTMIARGMATRPKEYQGVEPSEVLELLARQAFQSFDIQLDHSALTFAIGKPSKATDSVPAYLYDIPAFESVQAFDQFKQQICNRANGGLKTKFEQVWKAVQHLNQFLNYGIFDEVAIGQSDRRIVWANRSLHEFLLAFYFANYASKEESQYLWDWIYLPDHNDSDQYYPFWQFLCEMPGKARTASVWLESIAMLYQPNIRKQALEDKDPRDEGYGFYSKRSNEMIYRSWETLDAYTRNGFPNVKAQARAHAIRERWWGEFEGVFLNGLYGRELKATAQEITEHLLLIPAGTVTLGATRERQEWPELIQDAQRRLNEFRDPAKLDKFFAENPFFKTRAGKLETERRKEKLRAIFQQNDAKQALEGFLELHYGFTYVSNPELSIDAFKLGRQTINNAWYRLYNPRHTWIWSDYKEYSETLAHPAVGISFFDAWVYCQWLRWGGLSCRLPWETEWEYAAKYGFSSWELEYWWEGIEQRETPDRTFTKSRINCIETTDMKPSNKKRGCTVIPDPARASSGSKELDCGPEGQNKGLMDMQGNTWEWCQDSHRSNYKDPDNESSFPEQEQNHRHESLARDAAVSRVLRGGSFGIIGRNASASCRLLLDPTGTVIDHGFRVARAP